MSNRISSTIKAVGAIASTATAIAANGTPKAEGLSKAFFERPENARFFMVGQLFSNVVPETGLTYAAHVGQGDTVDFGQSLSLLSGQVELPLNEAQTTEGFSLENRSSWACPQCNDAHGAAGPRSKTISVAGLASNKFVYNPATKRLFVISGSCFDTYVKANGYHTRFLQVTPELVKKYVKPVAVAEVKKSA